MPQHSVCKLPERPWVRDTRNKEKTGESIRYQGNSLVYNSGERKMGMVLNDLLCASRCHLVGAGCAQAARNVITGLKQGPDGSEERGNEMRHLQIHVKGPAAFIEAG